MNQLPHDEIFYREVFEQAREYYKRIKNIYQKTGYEKTYPLGIHWLTNMQGLIKVIQNEDDVHKKINTIHETVMYSINTSNKELQLLMSEWYRNYFEINNISLQSLPDNIQESVYSNPSNSLQIDNRRVSPDFLRTVLICQEIKKYCKFPFEKFSVFELGAGYGGLARTLRLFYPNITTAISDIPETLYFSFIFLRLNFPDKKFCYVTNQSQLDVDLNTYDLIFIPTMFADNLKGESFELFYNTASLGEMRNEVIRFWMDFVQNKIDVNYFFGLNRYLNAIHPNIEKIRKQENECSVLFDPWWRILRWELDPSLARCPYLETLVSRNLEIIAQRIPAAQRTEASQNKKSASLALDAIASQDWFTHPSVSNYRIVFNSKIWPLTNTRADRLLTPDLTMDGELFKLWDSIRFGLNERNLLMMLQYLSVLEGRRPFEEMFYYEKMYKKITGRAWNRKDYPSLFKRLLSKIKFCLKI